jgi:hypothetical protein
LLAGIPACTFGEVQFLGLDLIGTLPDFKSISRGVRISSRYPLADPLKIFLLANLALAFYLVGAVWAIEVDIFRSWKLVNPSDFPVVQGVHWRKLPFWIFGPLALAVSGSIALVWYHPVGSPDWAIWGNLACQLASLSLTGLFWGRWQAKLSKDSAGSKSPYLTKILRTHWIRTALINAYAFIILVWAMLVLR